MKQKIKVRAIYDAMVKNGLEQIRGSYLNVDGSGNVISGCLLTQAAVHLNTVPASSGTLENSADIYIYNEINGNEVDIELGLIEVLNKFKTPLDSKWALPEPDSYGVGSDIVYWYDKREERNPNNLFSALHWYLGTYEEALAMAHDLLAPIFDEEVEIEVLEANWTFGIVV